MPAYQQTTIDKFKGLRYTDILNAAAMEDNEFAICDNFNMSEVGTLTKRPGWAPLNANVTATVKNPTTIPALVSPINIRLLAIQRRNPLGVNPSRVWFTDTGQTQLWCADLPSFTNVTLCQTSANVAILGVEWMVEAATVAQPYSMQGCRSNGNPFGCVDSGGQLVGVSASGPTGTHLTLFKDRLWMVNSISSINLESRVFYTDIQNYATGWGSTNFIDIQPANGEFCVCTIVFNDQLIIFKNRSTWVLTADGLPSNWVLRNLHPTIGCAGRGTPIIINGFIYFLSADGVYRTDGTTFERISEPIDAFVKSNAAVQTGNSVLVRHAYYYDDKYIVQMPVGGSNTTFYVYDLRQDCWTRWVNGGSPQMDHDRWLSVPDLSIPALWAGIKTPSGTGKVWQLNGTQYQDDNANYLAQVRTKRFDWGDPTKYKRNMVFMADVGYTQEEPENLTVVHSKDNVLTGGTHAPTIVSTTDVSAYDFARREMKFKGAGYHRAMYTQISYTGNRAMDIFALSWLNMPRNTVSKSN